MTAIDSYSHDVSGEKDFGFAQPTKVGDTIYVLGSSRMTRRATSSTRATSTPS
jgi:hypothetical protein